TAEPAGMKKRVGECMEKLTHRVATKVISITPSRAKYAVAPKSVENDKGGVLAKASTNASNADRFSPDKANTPQVAEIKKEFGILDTDFVVGYVGRVVKSKGVEEMVKAFESLREKYTNIKLFFVGPIELTSDAVSADVLEKMNKD